jgi:S-adenosylmethionine:tRNA ribosyltransferase-isomerase
MEAEANVPATPELRFEFSVPAELEAGEPPEARGLRRDHVRLMVSNYASGEIQHGRFDDLPRFLHEGDVLVINTSRTRNAAVKARRGDGTELELHLSSHLEHNRWSLEVRSRDGAGKSAHFDGAQSGETLSLPGGASATLLGPHMNDCDPDQPPSRSLWRGEIRLPLPVDEYLSRHGSPIQYNYIKGRWPLSYFQTVYATESGSAEMPSAGRPFTPEILEKLKQGGVEIAPLILHAGVSNLETHEPPSKEFYRVGAEAARLVNEARGAGRRIVAVGTTVVRALESVSQAQGGIQPGEGWTCLVIEPTRRLRTVDAMLTGLHEADATHLDILEALAGLSHIRAAYNEALEHRYLWHEFGDLHLIMA